LYSSDAAPKFSSTFLHSSASSAQSADLSLIVHRMGSTVLILNGSIMVRTGMMAPQ
jgi:hypothetical protein